MSQSKYPDKRYILRLIRNVNKSKRRAKKMLPPLEYRDEDWRIVFEKSLEFYSFLPSGRKLLQLSKYSIDFQGGYYYIKLKERP